MATKKVNKAAPPVTAKPVAPVLSKEARTARNKERRIAREKARQEWHKANPRKPNRAAAMARQVRREAKRAAQQLQAA